MKRNACRRNVSFLAHLFSKSPHVKNASTVGQIAVFTINIFLSDIVTLFQYIIDNSPFEPTNNQDFFEKSVFGVKTVLISGCS